MIGPRWKARLRDEGGLTGHQRIGLFVQPSEGATWALGGEVIARPDGEIGALLRRLDMPLETVDGDEVPDQDSPTGRRRVGMLRDYLGKLAHRLGEPVSIEVLATAAGVEIAGEATCARAEAIVEAARRVARAHVATRAAIAAQQPSEAQAHEEHLATAALAEVLGALGMA